MKVALLVVLGIVMLSHNTKAEEERGVDFDSLTENDTLTPEQIQELLDLDDDDVLEFFEVFDENDDGVIDEEEFDTFAAVTETLDDDDDDN